MIDEKEDRRRNFMAPLVPGPDLLEVFMSSIGFLLM